MASKQPRRSDLTSYLKFMAQTTLLPCLFGLFWPSFGQIIKNKKERKKNLSLLLDLSASPLVKMTLRTGGDDKRAPLTCVASPQVKWLSLWKHYKVVISNSLTPPGGK